MFNALQNPFALLGRWLLAALFLPAGIAKMAGFAGTVAYVGSVGLPLPAVGAAIALVVEVLGGLALVLGVGTRIAAVVLAIFTLVASYFFHPYWNVPAAEQMIPFLLFYKNIAVVGGLLILAAFGPGAWSIDAKRTN